MHKLDIHTRHDRSDRGSSLLIRAPWMSHIHPDHHRLLRGQPFHRGLVEGVIQPAELCIHLDGNIRQVLVLFSVVERLIELHMDGVETQYDISEAFDSWVDVIVPFRKKDEDEARCRARPQSLFQRLSDQPQGPRPPRILTRGGQRGRHQQFRPIGRHGHPTVRALVREILDQVEEVLVLRS